ncbi:MAG: tetratricopeptide repeat protein [Magnetococcus sp. YQC-3]
MNRQQRRFENKLSRIKKEGKFFPVTSVSSQSVGHEICERAMLHYQRNEINMAIDCYSSVTPSMPQYCTALVNLGFLYNSIKMHREAEIKCKEAISIKKDNIQAHINLCDALVGLCKYEEVVDVGLKILSVSKDSPEVYCLLGIGYAALGKMDKAEEYYRGALLIKPDHIKAINGFGIVMTEIGRLDAALTVFEKALEIDPNFSSALNNKGNILLVKGRLYEAKEAIEKSLINSPNDIKTFLNYGLVLLELGQIDDAELCYRNALKIKKDDTDIMQNMLFMHNYRYNQDLKKSLVDAKNYGNLVSSYATPYTHIPNPTDVNRRLRVGIVSGDLLNHPVGYYIEGILPLIDKSKIEIFVYSNFSREDDLTHRLKQSVSQWNVVVGISDELLAMKIKSDCIDVLMDLSGHTARNRLSMFAWKPSPVQVTWLGYFATTGLPAMDYLLGDPFNLPENEACNITETPWRLPDCYLCFSPPDLEIDVGPLPALRNKFITFCCFNNTNKINDAVISCWSKILKCVPGSKLVLKSANFSDSFMRQKFLEKFAHKHVFSDRLILEGRSERDQYFASYNSVDIALDPFPYPGVTTSIEGLWMGVPLITLKGNCYLAHQGESILSNVGLADFVSENEDVYIENAVMLAYNIDLLVKYRSELRQKISSSPLFDAQKFSNNLVNAWRGMWKIFCEHTPS